jgi:integrase
LYLDFYHQSKRYKRSLNLDDTKSNRKYAQQRIIPEFIYKLNSGEFFNIEEKNKMPTMDEFAHISLNMHKATRRQVTTDDYMTSYRLHIKPYFGEKKLDSIKPSDIALWQNELLSKVSPRRIHNIRAVFNGIIMDAMRDEIIIKNPISLIKRPKGDKVKINPFSLEDIKLILTHAEGDLKPFCALGFFTGMRSGEMIGLRWEDVDFEKKEIYIQRAIKMGVTSKPKTESSTRRIDILEPLMPYLKEQYKNTGSRGSYVFLNNENNHYYDIKRIRLPKWTKLIKQLHLDYRPIYHMRHTFATLMIENGEDILWVANMLGHTDIKMTLDRYAQYVKRDDKKRAQFLNSAL